MKVIFNQSFSSEGGLPIPTGSQWEIIKDESVDYAGRPSERVVTLKRIKGKKQRRLYYKTLISLFELEMISEIA